MAPIHSSLVAARRTSPTKNRLQFQNRSSQGSQCHLTNVTGLLKASAKLRISRFLRWLECQVLVASTMVFGPAKHPMADYSLRSRAKPEPTTKAEVLRYTGWVRTKNQ